MLFFSIFIIAFFFGHSQLLNQYPFLLSHDAATGEMDESRDGVVDKWAQTQNASMYEQLECGSRGFDYRPYYENGTLYAHHGTVIVRKPMEESLKDVLRWCSNNPNELVIFYITGCDGVGCLEAAAGLLANYKVNTISDCEQLQGMTFLDALKKGSLLGVLGCVEEQYDPTQNCYGPSFVCYDESTKQLPWSRFQTYMKSATDRIPVSNGNLWMAQGHWQSTALTVTYGTLRNSSLLLDESRSGMNAWIEEKIKANYFRYLNLVEVDHVCDGGREILAALKAMV